MGILNKLIPPIPKWLIPSSVKKAYKDFESKKPKIVIFSHTEKETEQWITIAEGYGYDLMHISQSKDPNPFSGMFLTNYTLIFRRRK